MEKRRKRRGTGLSEIARRCLAVMLAVFMTATMMPYTAIEVKAWEDDGEEMEYCWGCEEVKPFSEFCLDCCCCEDCQEEMSHCAECGTCCGYESGVWFCNESGPTMCEECLKDNFMHCVDCGDCYCTNQDEICISCGKCANCIESGTGLCSDCGMCFECAPHCYECGECGCTPCPSGAEHCVENECELCPACEEVCFISDVDPHDPCEYCGLCEDCCAENQCPDCGMCCEDPDYETHYCDNCGVCMESYGERCEDCGLCVDCCLDFAADMGCHCGDYCHEEIPDEHICEDCGMCEGETFFCEDCHKCVDCCEETSLKMGCDCDHPVCVESTGTNGWDEHLATVHGGVLAAHSASPDNVYTFDSTKHWKNCRYCKDDDASHRTSVGEHKFGKSGVCSVCGYSKDATIIITKQPKSVTPKVSQNASITDVDVAYNYWFNKVKFYVGASGSNLTYKWYSNASGVVGDESKLINNDRQSGVYTNTLSVSVSSDCDNYCRYFGCEISDGKNVVYSELASMQPIHNYILYDSSKAATKDGHYMKCCGNKCKQVKLVPHEYGDWTWTDEAHTHRTRTCSVCGYAQDYTAHSHIDYMRDHFYEATKNWNYDWDNAGKNGDVTIEMGEPAFRVESNDAEGNIWRANWNEHIGWCLEDGCETEVSEPHIWAYGGTGWQGLDNPPAYEGDIVPVYRQCGICGYYQYAVDKDGKAITWEFGVHPIDYEDCIVSAFFVRNNEFIYATALKKEDKHVDHWKVVYSEYSHYDNSKSTGVYVNYDSDEIIWLKDYIEVDENDPTKAKIDSVDYDGGGPIKIKPVYADGCLHDHQNTEIKNAVAATCGKGGYTGDTVCKDCGKVLVKGTNILPGPHGDPVLVDDLIDSGVSEVKVLYKNDKNGNVIYKRNGEPIVVARKSELAVCNKAHPSDGYTGDKVCPVCYQVVERGKKILAQNAHNYVETINYCRGLLGDPEPSYKKCTKCGDIVEIPDLEHSYVYDDGYYAATCTTGGYSGDEVCECGVTLTKGHYIKPLGHSWTLTRTIVESTDSAEGKAEYTCSTCGETKIDKIRNIANATVTVENATYTGKALTPSVKVVYTTIGNDNKPKSTVLSGTNDYGVEYSDNINVGTGKVTITGKVPYFGTTTATFTIEKAPSAVSVNSVSKTLTYTGFAQELVSAALSDDGTILYALGSDAETAPTAEAFTEAVPTAVNAGVYYVWYLVKGDSNHLDSAVVKVNVTIAKADITPSVSLTGWTAGENANVPVVSGNSGNGAVTFIYAKKDGKEYSAAVPTEPGVYVVKASIAETDNYKAGEAKGYFTIAAAITTTSNENGNGSAVSDNNAGGGSTSGGGGSTSGGGGSTSGGGGSSSGGGGGSSSGGGGSSSGGGGGSSSGGGGGSSSGGGGGSSSGGGGGSSSGGGGGSSSGGGGGSSSGGGGGSTGGTTTTPVVTTNPDGSTTTTTTKENADGSTVKTEVTEKKDGTIVKTEVTENKDGSTEKVVLETSKDKDGAVTQKITSASTSAKGKETVISYEVDSKGTVTLSKLKTGESKVDIPDTVMTAEGEKPVTIIAKNAFRGNKKLKQVTIGKNIVEIKPNVFKNAKKLKEINIDSNKIKKVGKGAFDGIADGAVIKIRGNAKSYKKTVKTIKKSGVSDNVKFKRVKK